MTTSARTVGLLHPGEMGSAVGASMVGAGARVVWASEGRGEPSRARARGLGLEDVESLAGVAARSDTLVSVVPPHAALAVARAVAILGFRGLYVDAN
ncbi:MAG TPA: hypothetical protein VMT79_13035, partial [Candidatus Binatia bacterium]|nr:hypothetical protein [Candidatus Binatia bacterium]